MIIQKELEKITKDNSFKEIKNFKGHSETTYSIEKNGFKISIRTSKWGSSKFIHSLTLEKGAMIFEELKDLLNNITNLIIYDK